METKYKPLVDYVKKRIDTSPNFIMNPIVVLGCTEDKVLSTFDSMHYPSLDRYLTEIKMNAFRTGADFAAVVGCGVLLKSDENQESDQFLKEVEQFMSDNDADLTTHPDAEEVIFIHYETIEGKTFAEVAPILSGQIGTWEEIPLDQNANAAVFDNLLEIRRDPSLAQAYTALLEKQDANPTLH